MIKKIKVTFEKEMFDKLFTIARQERRSVPYIVCQAADIFLNEVSDTGLSFAGKSSLSSSNIQSDAPPATEGHIKISKKTLLRQNL
jgi:hypothetical protein